MTKSFSCLMVVNARDTIVRSLKDTQYVVLTGRE